MTLGPELREWAAVAFTVALSAAALQWRGSVHAIRNLLEGKRIAVIDDSIVRGTTSRKIVRMLKDAGAAEVHMRVSSPPTRWPCFYGIDTPSRSELIASDHTIEEISRYIGADSLAYLSIEGLHQAVGLEGYCDACFSGDYPVAIEPGETHRAGMVHALKIVQS